MASPVYSGVAMNRPHPISGSDQVCSLLDDQHLAHRVDPIARPAQPVIAGDGTLGLGLVGDSTVRLPVEMVDDGDLEVLRGEQVSGDAADEQCLT